VGFESAIRYYNDAVSDVSSALTAVPLGNPGHEVQRAFQKIGSAILHSLHNPLYSDD
jgi:hypothetical protein